MGWNVPVGNRATEVRLLAVDHSREATFIAAAGFAVATLPFVNSPTAGIPSLRHLGAQALALNSGSTATASTNR